LSLVESALRQGRPGAFQIQAAIAALHSEAADARQTDWQQIALLYCELARYLPSPVVALNHAAAVAMANGPESGLRLLDHVTGGETLAGYYMFHATRADLARRAGRFVDAAAAYRRAIALSRNEVETRFLERRLREVTAAGA
jgi:RNA polymerase sigma-70 factor (ECF subfamily)